MPRPGIGTDTTSVSLHACSRRRELIWKWRVALAATGGIGTDTTSVSLHACSRRGELIWKWRVALAATGGIENGHDKRVPPRL